MARIVWSGFDPCEVKTDDNGIEYTQPYYNSDVESQKYSFYTESGENITIDGNYLMSDMDYYMDELMTLKGDNWR